MLEVLVQSLAQPLSDLEQCGTCIPNTVTRAGSWRSTDKLESCWNRLQAALGRAMEVPGVRQTAGQEAGFTLQEVPGTQVDVDAGVETRDEPVESSFLHTHPCKGKGS